MRKLPSPWSIIWTDNAYRGITTIAPVVCLMALVRGPGRGPKPRATALGRAD
jgi:hypothetical protein